MDAQSSTRKSTKPDTHQMITDRIIADLESGTIPWRKRMVLTASSQAQKAADHITGTAEPRS